MERGVSWLSIWVYPTRHSLTPHKHVSNHTDSRHNRCFCRRV
ncbi:Hypothetical protein PFR_JS12-3_21 [Propionibacterium freudenreichii]|nr:Hypothetical protein PFR_JS12-3_21 [Propionibacterium freudenreichii]